MSQNQDKIEHRDILGTILEEKQWVCCTDSNSLYIGQVLKLTPKKVKVGVNLSGWAWSKVVDPHRVVVVDQKKATLYAMRKI